MIVVLGGCRFLGAETAVALAREGHDVVAVDERPCPGPMEGVRVERAWPGDPGVLRGLAREAEAFIVFHEYDGVVESIREPRRAWRENAEAAANAVLAAVEGRVEAIVYASTAAVYGDQERVPVPETAAPEPKSTYGATRLAGERLVAGVSRERGLRHVILRYFNVYGPGEWNRGNPGVVHRMITGAILEGTIRVEGDGSQTRDFLHAADAVRAAIAALRAPPGTYNVGTGVETRIIELAEAVARLHGEPLDLIWAPERPSDIRRSAASTEKAREALGWRPLIPLREGLRHLYRFYAESLR